MTFVLPNPTSPTNGQSLDATPILQNLDAITSAIQSFDGSQIQSNSIVEAALANVVNPRLRGSETIFDHVASGCVWSADSAGASLAGSMTAGTVYINGYRTTISSISGHAFTASKDTYVDVDYLGNITYSEVTNNSASPSLAANSIRLGIIVTGGSSIAAAASINQGQQDRVLPIASSIAYAVTDSLGNLICPRDPQRKVLGYRQITAPFTTTNNSTETTVTGLSVPVIVPANRRIKLVGYAGGIKTSGSAGTALTLSVMESSTYLAEATINEPVTTYNASIRAEGIISPSSGSHTYIGSVYQSAAGTLSLEAGTGSANNYSPAFVLIELA